MRAADPPPDLAKRVAERETATAAERSHYAYTQQVRLDELDPRGVETGTYKETREIIFSPTGDRTERFTVPPESRLKNLILTDEDFADIRNLQPFVMTTEQMFNYETEYKGEEHIENDLCWVLRVKPRHILSGQRLFDGLLWIREEDFSVVRSAGQAVPQIVTAKKENLFPRFTTVRRLVNGFWFPSLTSADDTLYFRNGAIREKLTIRYNDYKRFGSDTKITFDPRPQ